MPGGARTAIGTFGGALADPPDLTRLDHRARGDCRIGGAAGRQRAGETEWRRDRAGHPVGATGAIITVKAMDELGRIDGRRALITMCIGGGQGIVLANERL
jgi:hypothetical protein